MKITKQIMQKRFKLKRYVMGGGKMQSELLNIFHFFMWNIRLFRQLEHARQMILPQKKFLKPM